MMIRLLAVALRVCIRICLDLRVHKNKILFGQKQRTYRHLCVLVALQTQAILIIYEYSAALCVERRYAFDLSLSRSFCHLDF